MHRVRCLIRVVCAGLLAVVLVGCGEGFNADTSGAEIVSLDITPAEITASDTGMTDEFFEVTIETAGFEDPILPDNTEVFRQEPEQVVAQPADITMPDDTTIVLTGIAKSWFGGLEPGTYNVGALVESETESVRQLDLATVTITE